MLLYLAIQNGFVNSLAFPIPEISWWLVLDRNTDLVDGGGRELLEMLLLSSLYENSQNRLLLCNVVMMYFTLL